MAQASSLSMMMWSCKCFPHASKMPTLTYNWAERVIIENALILKIMHKIFNLRDTEVVKCIILVRLKRQWSKPLSKYQIVYKAISRPISETIQSTLNQNLINYQYHLSLLYTTDRILFNKLMYNLLQKHQHRFGLRHGRQAQLLLVNRFQYYCWYLTTSYNTCDMHFLA